MTLRYNFETNVRPIYRNDWDVDYDCDIEAFEYEPYRDDVIQFFNELSEIEFVDGCKHAWEQLDEEEKNNWLDPKWGYAIPELMNGNEFNWNAIYKDLDVRGDFITELLMEDEEYWEDELRDHFEQEARDDWEYNRE